MSRCHEVVKNRHYGVVERNHTKKRELATDRSDLPAQLVEITSPTRFQYTPDGIFLGSKSENI